MSILKSVKNYVTGGAADVHVEISNPVLNGNESIRGTVKVTSKDNLFVPEVYCELRALEKSENEIILYADRIVLQKDIQLGEGDQKSWEFEMTIPAAAPTTFIGRHSSLKWSLRGGLDLKGVDPKSKWAPFVVNRATVFEPQS